MKDTLETIAAYAGAILMVPVLVSFWAAVAVAVLEVFCPGGARGFFRHE